MLLLSVVPVKRKPSVMVVETAKAKDWTVPDDGRRIFDGKERIAIAERVAGPAQNLPPWVRVSGGEVPEEAEGA